MGSSLKIHPLTTELDCKSNNILLSRVVRYAGANDLALTDNIREADLVVVNTCAFDEEHERMARDVIRDALRQVPKGGRVVSLGCLNSINPGLLRELGGGLEIVDDPAALDRLIDAKVPFAQVKDSYLDDAVAGRIGLRGKNLSWMVRSMVAGGHAAAELLDALGSPSLDKVHLPQIVDELAHRNKLYVLIGKGCVGNCSYCIIKKAKGAPVSRRIEDVLADIRSGYQEGQVLNLVAEDCGSFGADTGESLFSLVHRINQEFPGIPIDFCYMNPFWMDRFPDGFVKMFSEARINSINVSMQSGSDRVIALMNRGYRAQSILDLVDRLREVSPSTMFWGHFLLGFPTETWPEFMETVRAAEHFDMYFAFPYSPRAGTASAAKFGIEFKRASLIRKRILYARLAFRIANGLFGPPALGDWVTRARRQA